MRIPLISNVPAVEAPNPATVIPALPVTRDAVYPVGIEIELNCKLPVVVFCIVAVPAAPPRVTLVKVVEPQEVDVHPKVVVVPVFTTQELLELKLAMPLKKVPPLLVTVPEPRAFEEPMLRMLLFTVRPSVKVFLPLSVVVALIVTAPVPVVALTIFQEQREAPLIVKVSIVDPEPKARVPEPKVPPLPIVRLLPLVASVPLLMVTEEGVKLKAEPAMVAIVAVDDPDTVIAPVKEMSPWKVIVEPVFSVQGLATVMADVAESVPPAPVSVLEVERLAGELTERLPPLLKRRLPENVLTPERVTGPVIFKLPIPVPVRSLIVPAKVEGVEAIVRVPLKASAPVLGLKEATLTP